MRLYTMILAAGLALSGCGTASAADTTLRYGSAESGDRALLIEADSEGRIRVEEASGQMLIVRDGETYVVFFPREGERAIARMEDFVAVGGEVREQLIRAGAMFAEEDATRYALREQVPHQVGQWQGTRFEVGPVDAPGAIHEIVVSTDPGLDDARRVAVPVFEAWNRMSNAVLQDPPEYARLTRELLGRGMPISVDGLDLQSVSNEAIAADRFDLPGPVLSRDQLRSQIAR